MRFFKWLWARLRRRKAHIEFTDLHMPDNIQSYKELQAFAKRMEKAGAVPKGYVKGGAERYMKKRDEPTPVEKILDNWRDIDNGPRKKEKPNG